MKTSGIYKIINKINGKYYIGSSKDILSCRGRWKMHIYYLNSNKHQNTHLQRAWNKYGESSFDFTIIQETLPDKLLEVEQHYLNEASKEKSKTYNMSFVAGKVEMTDEIRKKISLKAIGHKRNLGRKYGPQTAIKRTENRRRNGKPWINEITKQKISKARMGHVNSPESIQRMSEKLKGRKPWNVHQTVYTFINKITNETYIGLKSDFIKKYNLFKQPIYLMINGNGRLRSYKGWIVVR